MLPFCSLNLFYGELKNCHFSSPQLGHTVARGTNAQFDSTAAFINWHEIRVECNIKRGKDQTFAYGRLCIDFIFIKQFCQKRGVFNHLTLSRCHQKNR